MDGLIGKKLAYSYSKVIHESLSNQPYALIETDDLKTTLTSPSYQALNITNPYKAQAATYCTQLDSSAKQTGVVNTIVKAGVDIVGYNTDVFAVLTLFRGRFPSATPVSIIGNGATATSIAAAFTSLGHQFVRCYARHPNENDYPLDALYEQRTVGILINATPVGTAPNLDQAPVVVLKKLRDVAFVFDVVYNPYRTQLLTGAKQQGIPHMNGLMMLVLQAVYAHEIVHRTSLDSDMVKSLYDYILSLSTNIVLIGMPGVGKSHLALSLAKHLNRPAFDSDLRVEAQNGLSVASMLRRYGEKEFRKYENSAVSSLSVHRGTIIATGGGVVTSDASMRRLSATGFVIYIKTDTLPSQAILDGARPLLNTPSAWRTLYQQRAERYERYADLILNYDPSFERLLKVCEVNYDAYLDSQRPQFEFDRHA